MAAKGELVNKKRLSWTKFAALLEAQGKRAKIKPDRVRIRLSNGLVSLFDFFFHRPTRYRLRSGYDVALESRQTELPDRKWDEFQVLLEAQVRLVRQLPDRYMIVSSRDAHRFVQFASIRGRRHYRGGGRQPFLGGPRINSALRLCRALRGIGWMLPHTSGWGER